MGFISLLAAQLESWGLILGSNVNMSINVCHWDNLRFFSVYLFWGFQGFSPFIFLSTFLIFTALFSLLLDFSSWCLFMITRWHYTSDSDYVIYRNLHVLWHHLWVIQAYYIIICVIIFKRSIIKSHLDYQLWNKVSAMKCI